LSNRHVVTAPIATHTISSAVTLTPEPRFIGSRG
jgi:hypothetical protein